MNFERFNEIWTVLVANRAPSPDAPQCTPCLNNGVSEKTVDSLVAVAEGDHSEFDEIQKKLAAHDAE